MRRSAAFSKYGGMDVWTLQMQNTDADGESYRMADGDEEPADGGGIKRGGGGREGHFGCAVSSF